MTSSWTIKLFLFFFLNIHLKGHKQKKNAEVALS